jgi:cobalt/nickel transport system ATP-binding protein
MSASVIRFENVSFRYKGDRPFALVNVSVALIVGQRTVLVGPNGAGKSTLLLHMNGILRPQAGKVLINGKPFDYSRAGLLGIRQKVGIVFQDSDAQLFAPTVAEDISFGPMNLRLPLPEVKRRVANAMNTCGIAHLEKMPVHNLSGGEKKRVALAGVLAMSPDVLVLDEPTAGLDPEGIAALFQALDALVASGVTVVYSTHDMDLAMAWSDAAVLLRQGQVVKAGSSLSVLGDDALMQSSCLKTPSVISLSRALCKAGVFLNGQPRTLDELAALINGNVRQSFPKNTRRSPAYGDDRDALA